MKQRHAFIVCEVLLLACALYALRLDLAYLFQRVAVPYQFDYEEGNILNAGLRITRGQTPYPDPHQFPNALNPYGPVPYLLVAAAIKVAGVGFLLPRLVIALSAIAIGWLAALLVRRYSGSWLAAVAFGALFLSVPLVQDWMPIMRVDLLGLALSLGGLYWFSRRPERWLGGALLMAAAIFTKYSLLAVPAACLAWLLIEKQYRRAGGFAGLLAGVCAAGFGVMAAATRGHFAFHMFGTHADPFSWGFFASKFQSFLLAHALLVALAAAYAARLAARRTIELPLLYLVFAGLGSVTAGKAGSNGNHFLELVAALTICAGLGFSGLRELVRWRAAAVGLTALAAALLGNYALVAQPYTDPARGVGGCAAAYEYVRAGGGARILTENTGAALLAGKPLFISNPFVYRFLVINRGWSDLPIQAAVRARQFDLILLAHDLEQYRRYGSDRWSPAVVEAMAQNYAPAASFGCVDARVALRPR